MLLGPLRTHVPLALVCMYVYMYVFRSERLRSEEMVRQAQLLASRKQELETTQKHVRLQELSALLSHVSQS